MNREADVMELALAAMECSNGSSVEAMQLLRTECGWTLRQAHHVLIEMGVAATYRNRSSLK